MSHFVIIKYMPTTYAHYRFGDKAICLFPSNYQDAINSYRDEFNYGVHGPDIFFYYDCLHHNDVNEYGTWIHEQVEFKEVLKSFKEMYKKHDNKKAAMSYLLGFLCHFALDSYAHGYIDAKAETVGPVHSRIESQYDRYCLIKDGYNPVKTYTTFSLKPTKSCCHNIAQLYDKYDEETITKSLKDHVKYLDILKDTNFIKRFILKTIFKLMKNDFYAGLLIDSYNDPTCEASNMRIDKYFDKALEHLPILAKSYIDYFENDIPLDEYFRRNFIGQKSYKQIPILDVEEEKLYQVEFSKYEGD